MYTRDVKVTVVGNGSFHRVHLSISFIASSNIVCLGPVTLFRPDSIAGQILCCDVYGSLTGLELPRPEALALLMPSVMNIVLRLTTAILVDSRVYHK